MNINLKQILTLTFCVMITACATNTPSNQGSAYQTKIQAIHLEQLNENVAINAGGNVATINDFKAVQRNLNDFSSNAVLKAALEHNVLDGRAFADNVIVASNLNKSAATPVLTPVVIMSSDYAVVNVLLINRKADKQNNVIYSSLQRVGSHRTTNKQYWIDNPLILKEKIVNGLYDVAKQFANDVNCL